MIAIHQAKGSFSDRWISYCEKRNLPYRVVDCYSNNIIDQLKDCSGLMWHFHHAKAEDYLMAKQLLTAVLVSGKKAFPDINTMWHFDDKVAQKYLLEALSVPVAKSFVFFQRDKALEWINQSIFPKVFKLRGGAGSVNVILVKNKKKAKKLIEMAFGKGFSHTSIVPFEEIWRKFLQNKVSLLTLCKSFIRQFRKTYFSKVHGKEKGYVYFQEFIPGNDHDIRVVAVGDKAFAIKRMVRKNDFRASGSGHILYEKVHFSDELIRLAFDIHHKLKSQCTAMDFVFDRGNPLLVEISYGFSPEGYDPCPGYWDKDLSWHEGSFDPYGWMVELVGSK